MRGRSGHRASRRRKFWHSGQRLTTLTHLSFTAGPSLMTFTGAGQATRMQGMSVAPGYFETLGVSAGLGRIVWRRRRSAGSGRRVDPESRRMANTLQRTA